VNEVEGNKKIAPQQQSALGYKALGKIIGKLHSILSLETIRLTGGEPTLYHDLVPLVQELQTLNMPIKLTTNGFLLKTILDKLPQKAFDSINVSLDALDEDVFFQISRRRKLATILEGIDAALEKEIHVKLNCVVVKGMNENQILPLLKYAGERNITIRFMELMKMGHLQNEAFKKQFLSEKDILELVKSRYKIQKLARHKSATANYWLTDTGYKFGIIANESEPFCHDCNRLRLDSFGNIYGCLSSNEPISLLETTNTIKLLEEALAQKQPLKFMGSTLSMLEIGG